MFAFYVMTVDQRMGKADRYWHMNRLKFKTSRKLAIVLEKLIKYNSFIYIHYYKKKVDHHVYITFFKPIAVLCDWQYYVEYSIIQYECENYST
jgi:hypothetical protein